MISICAGILSMGVRNKNRVDIPAHHDKQAGGIESLE
jgi:hypothetical protein